MSFSENGYAVIEGMLDDRFIDRLSHFLGNLGGLRHSKAAGVRNLFERCPDLKTLVQYDVIRQTIAGLLGDSAFAVRAILFDKTPDTYWYVTWHQDTTIAVQARHDVQGYGPWSKKMGIHHVRPPAEVLRRMVTLRIHLDSCEEENGRLRVIPGSHNDGILSSEEILRSVEEFQPVSCTVERGGCVVMSPLIVHSSSKSQVPSCRKVFHVEFANSELPKPLDWYERVTLCSGPGIDGAANRRAPL